MTTNLAQTWAMQELTYRHPKRYRELYLEEKGSGTGSKHNSAAQGRAKTRLVAEFRDDYNSLYREARDAGKGYGRPSTRVRTRQ